MRRENPSQALANGAVVGLGWLVGTVDVASANAIPHQAHRQEATRALGVRAVGTISKRSVLVATLWSEKVAHTAPAATRRLAVRTHAPEQGATSASSNFADPEHGAKAG